MNRIALTCLLAMCLTALPAAADADNKRVPTYDVHVELLAKSPTPTLEQIAPYTDALGVYKYKVTKVRKGKLEHEVIGVVHWVRFLKQEQRITKQNRGKSLRLRITPFEHMADSLQTVYRSELDGELDLPLYFDTGQKIDMPPDLKKRWNYGVDLSSMMPLFFEMKEQIKLVALGDCQAWFANKAQNYWTEDNLETPVALNMCQQRSGLPFQKLMVDHYVTRLPNVEWVVLTWNPRFVSAAWKEHGRKAAQFESSSGFQHDRANAEKAWTADGKAKPWTIERITADPRFMRVWRRRPWGWVYLAPDRHRFNPRGEVLKNQHKFGQYKFVPQRWEIFEQIVKTLAERDIKVLVYTTPIHPETARQKVKDKMGTDAAGYQDQVRRMHELEKQYPKHMFFYDLNNMGDNGLEDKDFENIDHVSASGAEKVSRRVEAFRRKVEERLKQQAAAE